MTQTNLKKVFLLLPLTGTPGHMVKTLNEIKQDLKLIDIVCIILDARVPFVSNNKDIYDIIKHKSVIMVFNKSDLADVEKLEQAEKKYKSEGCYTVRTNSVTGDGINNLLKTIRELGSRIKNKNKTSSMYSQMKNVYRVMVVGIPNVGKSSLINKLVGKNSAKVGNKPGVTKTKQWLGPAKDIEIMDTAGVLWPDLSENLSGIKLAVTGNIKDEVLDAELIAFELIDILKLTPKYMVYLQARYKLEDECEALSAAKLLEKIGESRGILQKGGIIDIEKTAKLLLDDFRHGKIGRISLE